MAWGACFNKYEALFEEVNFSKRQGVRSAPKGRMIHNLKCFESWMAYCCKTGAPFECVILRLSACVCFTIKGKEKSMGVWLPWKEKGVCMFKEKRVCVRNWCHQTASNKGWHLCVTWFGAFDWGVPREACICVSIFVCAQGVGPTLGLLGHLLRLHGPLIGTHLVPPPPKI